ncbi:hypothetical protein C0992_005127 [Termitomyces sp. T32_za158]|nr:hypothetical protein C0992_005127 [Termitomyces sp. T32_za158]
MIQPPQPSTLDNIQDHLIMFHDVVTKLLAAVTAAEAQAQTERAAFEARIAAIEKRSCRAYPNPTSQQPDSIQLSSLVPNRDPGSWENANIEERYL